MGLLQRVKARSARDRAQLSKHGVYHAGGEAVPGLFRQFHALIDGCMGGNAIEKEKLKRAETERDPNLTIELSSRPLEKVLQYLVEPNLPAQNAQHQCCSKIAIRGRERADFLAAQQVIGMEWDVRFPSLNGHENAEGCFARGRDLQTRHST